MPIYSNVPPENSKGVALPILRTPGSGKMSAIVTSDDLIGTNTHFWGGHTVPCSPPTCEACQKGVPYRWHAYLTAFAVNKNVHFLYECTATAAEVFVAYRKVNDHLRGCIFEAYRWRSTRNGRVMLRCEPSPDRQTAIPPAPDLEAVLAILWQLPKDSVKKSNDRFLGALLETIPSVPDQYQPPNPGAPDHGEEHLGT